MDASAAVSETLVGGVEVFEGGVIGQSGECGVGDRRGREIEATEVFQAGEEGGRGIGDLGAGE